MELLIALPLIAILALTIWHYELQVSRLMDENTMERYEKLRNHLRQNFDRPIIETYAKKAKDLAEKNAYGSAPFPSMVVVFSLLPIKNK